MLKAAENDNSRDILGGKLERESIYIDVAIGTLWHNTCYDASIVCCTLPNEKGNISNSCCKPKLIITMVKCLGMDSLGVHKLCKAGDPDPAIYVTCKGNRLFLHTIIQDQDLGNFLGRNLGYTVTFSVLVHP